MASVTYADAIKTVSGALTKINKKSPHAKDQKMVLATHRKAEATNKECSRIYLRGLSSVTRSTPVSRDELAKRERFTAVSRAVANRAQNLSTLTQDQEAYIAQKNLPNGKKSFKAYLWSLELAAYDAQHQG